MDPSRDQAVDFSGDEGEVLADGHEAEGVQIGESSQVRGTEVRIVRCRGFFGMYV